MTLHDKTASFETVMLRDALRKAAPHMAIGAGVGAAGGALMGGEGHRLEGALGGAALGAGAGGAVSHFGPAVRGWYEGLGRGASAAPAAATPAAIAQGSRRTVAGAAPATGIPEAWAPRLTQTPASVVSPQVSQTLDTMGRDARMAAGGGSARPRLKPEAWAPRLTQTPASVVSPQVSQTLDAMGRDARMAAGGGSARPRLKRGFDEGFLDALETFGLEKNAFFTAGLAAAGKALAPVAARAGAVAQRAAPVVSKGLQRAGNVLSHPLTDVGMSGAALWKNASTRAEALAMTDPAALKQLLARSGRALRPENPSLPHVRMLMNDVSAGEISPAMQALSAQAGRPVVADALAYARQHAPADVPDLRGDWLAGIRDVEGVGPRGKLPG